MCMNIEHLLDQLLTEDKKNAKALKVRSAILLLFYCSVAFDRILTVVFGRKH